jgi:hypothetical protein
MPRTTVVEVLACLEDEFAAFAEGFCRGEYLLWLGSGISRDVVPDVPMLLQRMLEFLRTNIDHTDPTCRFRTAFEEVLEVGGVPTATRTALDLGAPVDTWTAIDDIVGRLVDHYSEVLNVQVRGEADDFLVWDGLDVPTTYGAPGLEPDVAHLCVAILMLEGVVRSAPTTNWDGLVEAAMERLVGDADRVLRVIVAPVDFREPELQAELVKFHGCAVRAAADEAEYRGRLIARTHQISGWTTKPENQLMKSRLEYLFAARSAFIVGLSAQDANIHTVWHQATQNLARPWLASPHAIVFAEQRLHHHHKHVLQVAYGDDYSANADAIGESALLGAYAKQALVALLLFTLADKLCLLIGSVSELSFPDADLQRVRTDVRVLRNLLAGLADSDPRAFMETMVPRLALALMVFRTGRTPDAGDVPYQPISIAPIAKAIESADFPAATLGRLAVIVSLLGRGLAEGLWSLALGTPVRPGDGVVRVATGRQTARVFVVADSRSLSQLEVDGIVDLDDDDVLVIQAEATQVPATRSPRAHYGRTGAAGARWIDFEGLCATVTTADELFEAFMLEGAL